MYIYIISSYVYKCKTAVGISQSTTNIRKRMQRYKQHGCNISQTSPSLQSQVQSNHTTHYTCSTWCIYHGSKHLRLQVTLASSGPPPAPSPAQTLRRRGEEKGGKSLDQSQPLMSEIPPRPSPRPPCSTEPNRLISSAPDFLGGAPHRRGGESEKCTNKLRMSHIPSVGRTKEASNPASEQAHSTTGTIGGKYARGTI